jgi:hypothetical protein
VALSFAATRAVGLPAIGGAILSILSNLSNLGSPAWARARDRCPVPEAGSPALGDVDPARRLAWIDGHLSHAEKNARLWTFGWGGGIAAAGIGSLAAVPFVAKESRVDWYTGVVSAGVGVAAFVIAPPAVLHDAPALRAEITRRRSDAAAAAANAAAAADATANADTDVCPLLAAAEARLVHDARDEERQGRWYVHVGNLVFNAGLGLFLGLGYHHWGAGVVNALAGAAVGEAIIITRPTATIDDLGDYLRGAP